MKLSKTYWVIGGEVAEENLPSHIQIIDRPHPNVLFVEASEEGINSILLSDSWCYQVLGKVLNEAAIVN